MGIHVMSLKPFVSFAKIKVKRQRSKARAAAPFVTSVIT